MLKLACADFSFPLLDHELALELIRRLGFPGVDVGVFPQRSHFRPNNYLESPEVGARQLLERMRNHGLEIADIFLQSGVDLRDLAENHPDRLQRERSRDVFLRTVELVASCRGRHLTSLPGIRWKDESPADSFKRAAEELAWRSDVARSAGIVYAIEPHLWSVVPTPADAIQLLQSAPGLTLTLDPAHFTCQGIEDEHALSLVSYASHIHARAACRGLLQAPLFRNTINFGSMLQKLRQADYGGWIGVEYVRMSGVNEIAEVDNLSETILLRTHLTELAEIK